MALKPSGKAWSIGEQIVEDLASGLTFQFEVNDRDHEAPFSPARWR